jgi:ATP-dependent exoDNAse (exonuclease V) alpha subunit
MTRVALSDEQRAAVYQIDKWLAGRQALTNILGGFAGTGKSTIISHLVESMRNGRRIRVGAFTGKAVDVLRKKGIHEAQTLHSLFYKPRSGKGGEVTWVEVPELEADFMIIDEASMVPEWMYETICRFGTPTLFVGDHFQLPPVDVETGFNIMKNPVIRLETVFRQATHSGIIRLSMDVRTSTPLDWVRYAPEVEVIAGDVAAGSLGSFDTIICGRNETRVRINKTVRAAMGLDESSPVAGDKVICKQNDRTHGIFNGQSFRVKEVKAWRRFGDDDLALSLELTPDGEDRTMSVESRLAPFFATRNVKRPFVAGNGPRPLAFNFSYATTCHAAQGSEYGRALVVDETGYMPMDDESKKRWFYTAVTRAKQALAVVNMRDLDRHLLPA